MMPRLFFENWPRKVVAVLGAIVLWLFVNGSITDTKTIPNVPVRVINLPADRTISGLLPNRLLKKRLMLTISGSKDTIDDLEPGDIEVLLDASTATNDEWIVQISKKNLVSLNPSIDLWNHVTSVEYPEFVLNLSKLITAKIPIKVASPNGEAPEGYEYLDILPQKLYQTVSGPEEDVNTLRNRGLELILNLSDITKADLDAIKPPRGTLHDDEISFIVPDKWKKVGIPFHQGALEAINDPEAEHLRIDFLRKSFLPIEKEIPIRVFYPVRYSDTLNSNTHPLSHNNMVQEKNGITLLTVPVYIRDVSHLFVEIVRDSLEIDVIAAPTSERTQLEWSLDIVDAHELEDVYVATLLSHETSSTGNIKRREAALRKRFREYLQRLTLYTANKEKLTLDGRVTAHAIEVTVAN